MYLFFACFFLVCLFLTACFWRNKDAYTYTTGYDLSFTCRRRTYTLTILRLTWSGTVDSLPAVLRHTNERTNGRRERYSRPPGATLLAPGQLEVDETEHRRTRSDCAGSSLASPPLRALVEHSEPVHGHITCYSAWLYSFYFTELW